MSTDEKIEELKKTKKEKPQTEAKFEKEPNIFVTDREHQKLLLKFVDEELLKDAYFDASRWKGKVGKGPGKDDYKFMLNWLANMPKKEVKIHKKHEEKIKKDWPVTMMWKLCLEKKVDANTYFQDGSEKEAYFTWERLQNEKNKQSAGVI